MTRAELMTELLVEQFGPLPKAVGEHVDTPAEKRDRRRDLCEVMDGIYRGDDVEHIAPVIQLPVRRAA